MYNMNHEYEIKDILKCSGGIITRKDLIDKNIPTVYLSRMVEKGDLERVDRGIYISSDGDYDDYYFFQTRNKVAVYSYISALCFHQLTDAIPNKKDVTVYKGYNTHLFSDDIQVHYVNKDIYSLGITECKTAFGYVVKVYDIERTICDLIKSRKAIETELFAKTIGRYVRYQNKDLNKLYEYSKAMNIYEKVKDIFQIVYE